MLRNQNVSKYIILPMKTLSNALKALFLGVFPCKELLEFNYFTENYFDLNVYYYGEVTKNCNNVKID